MKRRFLTRVVFLFIFLVSGGWLFAAGNQESSSGLLNTEWTLCITAIDVSSLPPTRQIMGDAVARNLASSFQKLNFRVRGDEEYAYYRDYAWAENRAKAARALEAKRNERDLLVYRGDRAWKYRKNIKAADKLIITLEEEMARVDSTAPIVEKNPMLKLTSGNLSGTFPVPPNAGGEYRFCTDQQKADAFVTGQLLEYHGRMYLNIKLFTRYTNSFSFEDFVLFSSEDFELAVDEIYYRLAEQVSGTLSAGILVRVSPMEAMILIDDNFAGTGETEIISHPPGTTEISVFSHSYTPVSMSLELNAGELADISFTLTPLGRSIFGVDVPGKAGSKVFIGGLYVGETPLSLDLVTSEFAYISVETTEGEIGTAVYKDNDLVRGSAQFVRTGSGGNAAFSTILPASPEEKRVDKARRGFYGAYGAFWVILPAALIIGGVAGGYVAAYNYGASTDTFSDYDSQKEAYDRAVTAQYVQVGTTALWGASLGVTLFQIARYLFTSHKAEAVPIVKGAEK